MKITILGSGPSRGLPALDKEWGACDPTNPKNRRTRCSLLIQAEKTNVLVDTSPEVRLQLIKAGNPPIDAVLYTHLHYDHCGGAGDLATFHCHDKKLPLYIPEKMIPEYQRRYDYIFSVAATPVSAVPIGKEPFTIKELTIQPILQNHGEDESYGYRIGRFAYTTDVKYFTGKGLALLQGIDTWVIGVVTHHLNNKHINLQEAMRWIERVQPKRVYLTHLGIHFDYDDLCQKLPPYIRPAYDGLTFTV